MPLERSHTGWNRLARCHQLSCWLGAVSKEQDLSPRKWWLLVYSWGLGAKCTLHSQSSSSLKGDPPGPPYLPNVTQLLSRGAYVTQVCLILQFGSFQHAVRPPRIPIPISSHPASHGACLLITPMFWPLCIHPRIYLPICPPASLSNHPLLRYPSSSPNSTEPFIHP